MFSARPTQPLWSLSSPVLGQVRGQRGRGAREARWAKPGMQQGGISRNVSFGVSMSEQFRPQFRPPLLSFLFPSPMSRKTPSVSSGQGLASTLTRAHLLSSGQGSPESRGGLPSQWPVLSSSAGLGPHGSLSWLKGQPPHTRREGSRGGQP